MGRLERHLDQEAIARVLNKTPRPERVVTLRRHPRKAWDYRGNKRNEAKGLIWHSIDVDGFLSRPPARLNRSRHHPFARTYAKARETAGAHGAEVQRECVA